MKRRPRHSDQGQVLVIVAMGLVVIVAMVGLIIDGGRAWTYQRDTQNGADAVAKAGAGVLQHYLAGSGPTDGDVGCAADEAARANAVVPMLVEYTDFKGDVIGVTVGTCGTAGAIPSGAQGVRAHTSETFDTLLMSVIGIPTLTAEADAIAVVGTLQGFPGGALPVTFPQTADICDRVNPVRFEVREDNGNGTWEPYEIVDPETTTLTTANEAIVPLCDRDISGSVGWLDWGCHQNLRDSISNPCDIFIPIPAWVQTQPGDANSLEAEINAYAGDNLGIAEDDDSVLALPIHDGTCLESLPDRAPISDCPSGEWSGNGNNGYYHIPFWVGFKLDRAYVQGGDRECGETPGSPLLANPDPPGKVGCLKGWFVAQYTAPGEIGIGVIPPNADQPLGVTLVN